MSENIDINVAIIKEEVSINAANNLIQVNINTAPISIINPQNYDLSQFTNTSFNPFVQQSTLGGYVPSSRIININGIAQDLSSDRSWTIPIPSITGLVPYIGATGNVNLGEYELKAGQLTLDTSPTGTAAVGTTRWNDTIGSSETTLKGGSVILKNGVDLVARVVNKVTPNTTLTKANYPVVRVSGAQGQRLAIAYAQANNDNNSADTLGLVIETIATNQEGFIMTVGQLEEVNTTGSLQGETWVDGDVLYLSPTTPGRVTNIKPTGLTGHIVVIGYVEYAHAVHGKIYVKIMNGWELDELHNVYINPATLANNDILQYDSTDSLWKNKVLATGLTVGTTPIASGTNGRFLFDDSGVLSETNGAFWDKVNGRFGIGTDTPASKLFLDGGVFTKKYYTNTTNQTINFGSAFELFGTPHSSNGFTFFINPSAWSSGWDLRIGDSSNSILFNRTSGITVNKLNSDELVLGGGSTLSFYRVSPATGFSYNSAGGWNFVLRGSSSENLRVVGSTGNVLINTTTDAGFRLDVNGTARVTGDFRITKSTFSSLLAFNSGAFGSSAEYFDLAYPINGGLRCIPNFSGSIDGAAFQCFGGTATSFAGQMYFDYGSNARNISGRSANWRNASLAGFTNVLTLTANSNVLINTTTDAGFRLDVNGTARVSGVLTAAGNYIQYGTNPSVGIGSTNNGNSFVNNGPALLYASANINSTQVYAHNFFTGTFNSTSGVQGLANLTGANFSPTSGTAVFNTINANPTINQTGGANGITRGLYVNPTLTSASDFRAIETTAGRIVFGNLPTSSAGLPTGAIWNDGGTLKIV
jgi:nitrogen fixation protein